MNIKFGSSTKNCVMMRVEDKVINASGNEVMEYTYIDSIKVPSRSTPVWRCGSPNCLVKVANSSVSMKDGGSCVVIPQYMWWEASNSTSQISSLSKSERTNRNVVGVRLPESLTTINYNAFKNINFNTKVFVVPRTIMSVESDAFAGSNVSIVIIPFNGEGEITPWIYAEAFQNSGLTSIIFEGTAAQFDTALRSHEVIPGQTGGNVYTGVEALKALFGTKKYTDADGKVVDTGECVINVTYNADYEGKYKPYIYERGYHIF